MSPRTKQVALCLAFLIAGGFGGWYYSEYRPQIVGPVDGRMPAPSQPNTPTPSRPDAPTVPGTIQAKRVEIVEEGPNGTLKVGMILTIMNGKSVAIISDNGKPATIDLVWLSRQVR